MPNPTLQQVPHKPEVQLKIAELQGYLWLEYIHWDGSPSGQRVLMEPYYLKKKLWRKADMSLPIDEGGMDFPNWHDNRNESFDLVKGLPCISTFMTALEECMVYIESEGWRWEVCDGLAHNFTLENFCPANCKDDAFCVDTGYCPTGCVLGVKCPRCSGKRGEWVKI